MQPFHRRDVLRFGSTGAVLSALPNWAKAQSGSTGATRKVLFVYLDGGADGLSMVFPHGDPNYAAVRGELALAPTEGVDLGSSVCRLNPHLQQLKPLYDQGDLALVQRLGRTENSRSHFVERLWLLRAAEPTSETGMLGRYMDDFGDDGSELPACSVDTRPSVVLERAGRSVPMIPSLIDYDLDGVRVGDGTSFGLRRAYEEHGSFPAGFTRIHRDGIALMQSVDLVAQTLPGDWPQSFGYPVDEQGDVLPFAASVRDAIWTLTDTTCRVAAVRQTGYDTHRDQAERLPGLLSTLARTLVAARTQAEQIWNDLAIVVVTEFGRNRTNGSGGTDHGRAGLGMVLGGRVQGGLYNGHSEDWFVNPALETSPILVDQEQGSFNGFLQHRTDYRTVYAELMQNHLGLNPSEQRRILDWPGESDTKYPHQWTPLGLFS